MHSSAVRVFTDPDEHAAAIRQGVSEMTLTGRGAFRSEIVRIDLRHLWMQRFTENMGIRPVLAAVPSSLSRRSPDQHSPGRAWN